MKLGVSPCLLVLTPDSVGGYNKASYDTFTNNRNRAKAKPVRVQYNLMNTYNRPRGGFFNSLFANAPMVKMILFINVGVFLFEMFFGSLSIGGVPLEAYIQRYLYLHPPGSGSFFPWQLITYQFLHVGFSHIFFNMFALVIFGPALEMTWGQKKFLIYYSICGLAGGLSHVLIAPLLSGGAGPLVGASGSIFGLLAAFGLMFPDQQLLIYFIVPVKAKYAVLIFILLEVVSVPGGDSISHLAHLGGAVAGIIFLLIDGGGTGVLTNVFKRRGPSQNKWQSPRQSFGGFRHRDEDAMEAEYEEIGSSRSTTVTKPQSGHRVITQEDIDRILDKIASSGYQNLSEEERQILIEASRKMDNRS
jgi:membrane associated rhomboid family serine protease